MVGGSWCWLAGSTVGWCPVSRVEAAELGAAYAAALRGAPWSRLDADPAMVAAAEMRNQFLFTYSDGSVVTAEQLDAAHTRAVKDCQHEADIEPAIGAWLLREFNVRHHILSGRIQARLDDVADVALNGDPYVQAIQNVLNECDRIEADAASQPGMGIVGKAIADQFRRAVAAGLGIESGEQSE